MSGPNKISIQWEDEDSDFDEDSQLQAEADRAEFADLLATDQPDREPVIRDGEKISGIISRIPPQSGDVIVEISSRHTGLLDKQDITDADGKLTHQEGDTIEAWVTRGKDGAIQLTVSMSKSAQAARDLETAYHGRIPVKGRVVKENKGGFEVNLMNRTAFCPVSKMDTSYIENKTEWIGRELTFLIDKFDASGRNLVVDRRRLLEQEAAEKLARLREELTPDTILDGTVKDLKDFGAIVDLGGMEGMVHISEVSWARVARIQDYLSRGEKVRVKVLSIEENDSGRPRISLSMKAVEQDPWLTAAAEIKPGDSTTGKVTNLTAFGAFVEIRPGIEGMIHISEMSWEKRIMHPSEVVQTGDEVSVRILSIDENARKIALTLKDAAGDPWERTRTDLVPGTIVDGQVEKLKGFGAIIAVAPGLSGLLPLGTMKAAHGEGYRRHCSPPKAFPVEILSIDDEDKKILLGIPGIRQDKEEQEAFAEYQKTESTQRDNKPSASGSFGELLAAKLADAKKSGE